MKPSLVALAGPLLGEVIALTDEPLTIGRDAANRLHPGDLSLSRQHCTVAVDDGRMTLTDHDSLNGSFVNGVPVRARILEHGDQVKIGESVFLFLHHDASVSAPWTIEPDDRVRIERATPSFKLVEMPGRGYYRTLREKLGWGGSLRMNHYPT